MKKLGYVSITMTLAAGAFLAGIAIAGPSKTPVFKQFSELQFDDMGGPKLAQITGNYKKGSYMGILQLPAGMTSPMHSHSGPYEAVQIQGTSSHWLVGEDGTNAAKMVPGSYWSMPGKLAHVSACATGQDCLILLIQKGKFDFTQLTNEGKKMPKEAAPTPATGATKPATPAPATGTVKPATPTPAPATGATKPAAGKP